MKYLERMMRNMGLHKEAKNPPSPAGHGIRQPFWFYGCEAYYSKPAAGKDSKPAEPAPEVDETKSADQQVQDILIQAPNISAPTLVSTMKARGLKVVDGKTEADSSSSNSATLRNQESVKADVTFRAQFLERSYQDGVGPTRFKVALIQEGLGNLRDGFFYTRSALENAIVSFEGKKCFADHPSRSEEQDRPERSVRDIVGHFEAVHIEEGQAGEAMLVADLVMPPDPPFEWARSLVRRAAEYNAKYPEQTFVGLSINASGDAEAQPIDEFLASYKMPEGAKPKVIRARDDGMAQVRVVSQITDAISCDLVTEPGAKGRVLEIIESNKGKDMAKKLKVQENEMEKKHFAKEEEKCESEEKKQVAKEEDGEEDHEDEEQDKALILDMIKKHMGDDGEMEGEAESAAIEACEAYKEMGYSEDEAMKCAAHAMRLAKHMAKKREAEEAVKLGKDGSIHTEGEEAVKVDSEGHIHTESEKLIKAEARIALLERELNTVRVTETLDKKLRESGLGRAETDKIRALIGTPKSVEHIEHTIKVFKEAFGSARGESRLAGLFVLGNEKEAATAKREGKFSFSDCVSE